MNRIRLLPEQVANQIAAGEVVERPASVVKELVGNALDARADRITVEIQAGGRGLIRRHRRRIGMSKDDALLCLERHATSKIQRAEDLAAIATMGFRGEALPSVASVSRLTLSTRERDSESPEPRKSLFMAGKFWRSNRPPCAGTSVEVRQLFYNLRPAENSCERGNRTRSYPALPDPGGARLSRGRIHLFAGPAPRLATAAAPERQWAGVHNSGPVVSSARGAIASRQSVVERAVFDGPTVDDSAGPGASPRNARRAEEAPMRSAEVSVERPSDARFRPLIRSPMSAE